jgi:hypothetical protein
VGSAEGGGAEGWAEREIHLRKERRVNGILWCMTRRLTAGTWLQKARLLKALWLAHLLLSPSLTLWRHRPLKG